MLHIKFNFVTINCYFVYFDNGYPPLTVRPDRYYRNNEPEYNTLWRNQINTNIEVSPFLPICFRKKKEKGGGEGWLQINPIFFDMY